MNNKSFRIFTAIAALAFSMNSAIVSNVSAADGTQQAAHSYAHATAGIAELPKIKLLLDPSNLGGEELELAELTLPAGTDVKGHTHGSTEIFYVLSGTFGHEVNGMMHMLTPGMVGVVRPGDTVRHYVPKDADAKVLVIWAPAGEARRIFDFSKGKPIEQPHSSPTK